MATCRCSISRISKLSATGSPVSIECQHVNTCRQCACNSYLHATFCLAACWYNRDVCSHLHLMIGYMGGMQGYQLIGMLKMPELYDRHLWRVEVCTMLLWADGHCSHAVLLHTTLSWGYFPTQDVVNKRLSEVGALIDVAKGEVSHHEKLRDDAGE